MDQDAMAALGQNNGHGRGMSTDGGDMSHQHYGKRPEPVADSRVVASRVVWYVAGFVVVMLVLRLVLFLLGANQGAPFVDFVYTVSGLFAAPFTGIFPTPAYGAFALDTASILAIVVYVLAAWGISRLFTLNRPSGSSGV